MEQEVVSDVHLFLQVQGRVVSSGRREIAKYPVVCSQFLFRNKSSVDEDDDDEVKQDAAHSSATPSGLKTDEDGDLVLRRRPLVPPPGVILIEHVSSTRLPDVGLQVWPGCLLLCDFIVESQRTFKDKLVVELGAGVGLASIVAAMFAKRVVATDSDDAALTLCSNNLALNKNLLFGSSATSAKVEVCKLDWTDVSVTGVCGDSRDSSDSSCFSDLYKADILTAADVIFDDEITDAFFRTVYSIMTNSSTCRELYLSVEKRLNFTLEDLDIACSAYRHFCECVSYLCGLSGPTGSSQFSAEIVPSIPQYFEYERSKYLELWKITVTQIGTETSSVASSV